MKVLVIGKTGQLGQCLQSPAPKALHHHFDFIDRQALDLTDLARIDEYFSEKHWDIIINCSAYTDVNKAEEDRQLATAVNQLAVGKLGEVCSRKGMKFIHISTDYVFAGTTQDPYKETAPASPLNVYGRSKYLGEQALLQAMPSNAMIIRTAWLYSEFGANFFKTIVHLANTKSSIRVINDQISTPTYAADLAQILLHILDHNLCSQPQFDSEIYHFVNQGYASWYDFACNIVELTGNACEVVPIGAEDYPSVAQRPKLTMLNSAKIHKAFHTSTPHWQHGLKRCFSRYSYA